MVEIWCDIKDYKNLYQISNLGNIKSMSNRSNHRQEKIMKQSTNYKGYKRISLCKEGKK